MLWNHAEEFGLKRKISPGIMSKGVLHTNNLASTAYLYTYGGILDPFLYLASMLTYFKETRAKFRHLVKNYHLRFKGWSDVI